MKVFKCFALNKMKIFSDKNLSIQRRPQVRVYLLLLLTENNIWRPMASNAIQRLLFYNKKSDLSLACDVKRVCC